MARRSSLRALAAILLTACLVLSLGVQLGAVEIGTMKKAATEACKKLGADCCQPSGERATHPPVQIPLPAVVLPRSPLSRHYRPPIQPGCCPCSSRLPRQR